MSARDATSPGAPRRGSIAILLVDLAVDLLLLPPRLVAAVLFSSRRRREIRELVVTQERHAAQDPHPPRR